MSLTAPGSVHACATGSDGVERRCVWARQSGMRFRVGVGCAVVVLVGVTGCASRTVVSVAGERTDIVREGSISVDEIHDLLASLA